MPKESKSFLGAMALLILALIWFLLGAPLTKEQFQGIPSQFTMSWTQLPVRAARMLSLWHLSAGASPASPGAVEGTLVRVYDMDLDQIVTLPLSEYLLGAVAEEMPASYHLEALKSQAVAARTRVVKQIKAGGCTAHPGADICSDPAHCQGYLNADKQKAKWTSEYTVYRDRVQKAVNDTGGVLITYENEPITVLYHAVSGGFTEDAQAVFGQSLPYLKSVESKGEEGVSRYESTQRFSNADAVRILNAAFPAAHLSGDLLPVQMYILTVTDSGRADTVQLGDTVVTGRDIREALSLYSTLFTIQADESSITFKQKGYGHGVGMSQAGANAMAANGADYEAILTHYYQGVTITKPNENAPAGEAL